MLTVACVKWGTKYGPEYVTILKDMVRRHLQAEHRFVCLTDDPNGLPNDIEIYDLPGDKEGWWNKIELFKPGLFEGRVMYFDLDVAIVGNLDEVSERKGIIQDWHLPTFNSSVMVWDAGDHDMIYTQFNPAVVGRLHGDQDWITMIGGWETFPASWCVSYRSHAVEWPPLGSRVVCFHGEPKPHDVLEGWVPKFWKLGGVREFRSTNTMNVEQSIAVEQMRENCTRDLKWLVPHPGHAGSLVIVGGAPSLTENIPNIRGRQKRNQTVLAVNNSWRALVETGLIPDIISIMDARPENAAFLEDCPDDPLYLIASQVHPSLLDKLEGKKVCLWHADLAQPMQKEILDQYSDRPAALIGGGGTVGLRMMFVGFIKGYRRFHLYGMDSCYRGDTHHAYPQSLNDGEQRINIIFQDKTYNCSPWMARQANEFKDAHRMLIERGCQIAAHGEGLLPDICRAVNRLYKEAA